MRTNSIQLLGLLMSLHTAGPSIAHAAETQSGTFDLKDPEAATVIAQQQPSSPEGTAARSDETSAAVYRLPETVVTGRQDSMIGIAAAASQGTVGEEQLKFRALARPGELLETVPGLILTQHSGGGKANQYFLRGFNLDHGTDFATSVNGVGVNLPSHGHGQGYADLNFMIPELVQRINFRKGVYYADLGDFSSAGGADLEYYDVLPHSIVETVGGRYGYVRELYASSPAVGRGHLLNALEILHEDGPWEKPDDFQKINGVARYSQGDAAEGLHVTAMAYAGKWNGTDQIARRALGESFSTPLTTANDFGLYDSLDRSDGGSSHRYGLSADWHRADADAATQILAYGFYYDLDLFSNFSYFLGSPQGDQIEQTDSRWVGGVQASHTWFGQIFGRDVQNAVGLQLRSDSIRNGLYNTIKRDRGAKFDYSDSPNPTIPATTRSDQIWEASLAPYCENRVQWTDKVRTIVGVRLDYYHVDVESHLTANSGTADDVQVSPKGSLILGPWAKTELYLSGGESFHSNDARGATQHVDPITREAIEDDDLLVRSYGAEIGARTTYVPGLQSTLSFWWLHLGSELVFVGDAGTTEARDPSQRYGVELANYYEPNDWVSLDADFSFSKARFTHTVVDDEAERSGTHIPEAVESVVATGISFHQPNDKGFFSELRLRYFGPRDLSVSGSPRSGATAQVSANLGYHVNDHITIGAELFNILDRKDHDIDYFYPSFVPGVDPAPRSGRGSRGRERCPLQARRADLGPDRHDDPVLIASDVTAARTPRLSAWSISLGVHALVVLALLGVFRRHPSRAPEPPPTRLVYVEPAPPSALPASAPLAPAEPPPPALAPEPPSPPAEPAHSVELHVAAPSKPRPPRRAAPRAAPESASAPPVDAALPGAAPAPLGVPNAAIGGTVGGLGDAPVPMQSVAAPPELVHRVLPDYPPRARALQIEGQVMLEVVLDRDGRIEDDVRVLQSVSGLDDAAIAAVRQWRFRPARNTAGQPVRVRMDVPVRFVLR